MALKVYYIRSSGEALPLEKETSDAIDELVQLTAVPPRLPHLTRSQHESMCKYFFATKVVAPIREKPTRGFLIIFTRYVTPYGMWKDSTYSHHFPDVIKLPTVEHEDHKYFCDHFPEMSPASQLSWAVETEFERACREIYDVIAPVFLDPA